MKKTKLAEKPACLSIPPSARSIYKKASERRRDCLLKLQKRRLGGGLQQETLDHIIRNVARIDIHPLAVITAKTNYLLALGDLLKKRGARSVQIPVYLADSINPPEEKIQHSLLTPVPSYRTRLGEKEIYMLIVNNRD